MIVDKVIRYKIKDSDRKVYYECGSYKIDNNRFFYKEINHYDFDECENITDTFYYDEAFRAKRKFRDLFENKIVLQSKKFSSILLLNSDFHLKDNEKIHQEAFKKYSECLKYQNIVNEDYSLIVTSLRSSGVI